MKCTSCGFENEQGAQFCEQCGSKLVLACPGCGREVRPTAKFCSKCGTPLQVKEKLVPAQRRQSANTTRQGTRAKTRSATTTKSRPTPSEAERRQLTVMFCDLV